MGLLPTNGNGDAGQSMLHQGVSSLPDVGATDSERIVFLENRVTQLENEMTRWMNAFLGAVKHLATDPKAKMIVMMLPKEAQIKIKEFLAANG